MDALSFLNSMSAKVDPSLIEGQNTCFHFDIEGAGGAQVTVQVTDGKLEVKQGFVGEPKCTVRAKSETLQALLSGSLNPMTALFTGKLKISNPGEMMKYAKIFGLM